jgi:Fe-S-cluster containining protein
VCRLCAACCKRGPFVQLDADEIALLEPASGLRGDLFTDDAGDESGRRFLRMKRQGECIFLEAAGGAHACGVYDARPAICREYPRTQPQKAACGVHSAPYRETDPGD